MNRPGPSIFDYQDPRRFLLDWLVARQSTEPGYSVRRWAREMDLSHALLLMLLQGKRGLKLKHVPVLARGMALSSDEKTYLQALVELVNSRSLEEESLAREWLRELNPSAQFRTREIDEFEVISSWLHFAILALCNVEGFSGDSAFFEKRLKSKATLAEIRSAVSRLESLGLLARLPDGRIFATQSDVTTKNDRGSEAVKKYHSEISRLAADAVLDPDVLEREFQSFALSVHRDQIPMVKEMIRKFRAQLVDAVGGRRGTDVYNVNLQFFRLTERPAETSLAEDEGVDTASTSVSAGEMPC